MFISKAPTGNRGSRPAMREGCHAHLHQIQYTEQGMKNIKESPARADEARKLLQSLGGNMKELYLTMGVYDLVVISEAPDAETITKFMLSVGASGNIKTTTLTAFPETEYRRIIGGLP